MLEVIGKVVLGKFLAADTVPDDTTVGDGLGLTLRLTVEEFWPRAV